jgi:hypothetical protein
MCEFYLNDVKIKGACGIYTFAEVCDGQKLEKMVTVRHCNGTIGPSGEIASYLDFYGFPEANDMTEFIMKNLLKERSKGSSKTCQKN